MKTSKGKEHFYSWSKRMILPNIITRHRVIKKNVVLKELEDHDLVRLFDYTNRRIAVISRLIDVIKKQIAELEEIKTQRDKIIDIINDPNTPQEGKQELEKEREELHAEMHVNRKGIIRGLERERRILYPFLKDEKKKASIMSGEERLIEEERILIISLLERFRDTKVRNKLGMSLSMLNPAKKHSTW